MSDGEERGGPKPAGDPPERGDLTREEMLKEFGEPGVANPNVVDLIAPDEDGRRVHLVMFERRPWGSLVQLRQLEEKINRYLGYVLDGYFVEQYPAYREHAAVLRLDCVQAPPPDGEPADFLEAAREAVREAGLELEVRVTPEAGS